MEIHPRLALQRARRNGRRSLNPAIVYRSLQEVLRGKLNHSRDKVQEKRGGQRTTATADKSLKAVERCGFQITSVVPLSRIRFENSVATPTQIGDGRRGFL